MYVPPTTLSLPSYFSFFVQPPCHLSAPTLSLPPGLFRCPATINLSSGIPTNVPSGCSRRKSSFSRIRLCMWKWEVHTLKWCYAHLPASYISCGLAYFLHLSLYLASSHWNIFQLHSLLSVRCNSTTFSNIAKIETLSVSILVGLVCWSSRIGCPLQRSFFSEPECQYSVCLFWVYTIVSFNSLSQRQDDSGFTVKYDTRVAS